VTDRDPILVTGATGFVGGHLVRRLRADGRAVRCLVRASSDCAALRALPAVAGAPEIEFVVGDLTDRASLRRAVAGCAEVVHSAAMVSDWCTVPEIRAANLVGAGDLAAAAADAGVRRFVQISTTDVYGYPGTPQTNEDHPCEGFANWYSHTKRAAERAIVQIGAERDLETVCLRPATIYGPGSARVVGEMALAMRWRYLPVIAGGAAVAGLVHVENLVDATLLALARPEAVGESFNVVDGLDVTWGRFLGDIADALGYPRPWIKLGYRTALRLAVGLEEGYRALRTLTGLTTSPLLSRAAVQILGIDQDFSNAKLRDRLGWTPRVDYAAGLGETVAWLRDEFLPAH
jgi:nucleoside-diphosphate-sugar epimerase